MAPEAAEHEYYEGTVCFADGWHWTVAEDEADRERCVAIAQAQLDFERKTGHDERIASAEAELERTQTADYHAPDRRLVCEDTEDGTESRYRLATDDDTRSWHDRKHGRFIPITHDGGPEGFYVNEDEIGPVKELIDEIRKGKGQ